MPQRCCPSVPIYVSWSTTTLLHQGQLLLAIVTLLSNGSPTEVSTSSRTSMSRHSSLSRILSRSPSLLSLVLTILFSLQLPPSFDQWHWKLNHRTFHVEPPITILMTAMRAHRTLKEQGPDRKMTICQWVPAPSSQYTRLLVRQITHHIEHLATASLHVTQTACVALTYGFLERTATTGFRHFRHVV